MIKRKSKILLTIVIFLAITLFIANPSICMQATLNGLKIWLFNVVPALFPFFILTRIICSLNHSSISILDKFTYKLFRTNNAGLIYPLSIMSGYPVGAKLISSYYEIGSIDKKNASKMLSFCSTSGPMFIIGTVGIGIFGKSSIGYILFIGHIIGSILNGLLYRGTFFQPNVLSAHPSTPKSPDIMYDSIISILLVGGYIVFSAVVIELLKISNILPTLASFICQIPYLNYDAVFAFLCGIIEMTNGLILLKSSNISIHCQIIISSILIAFSGISILLQSSSFLKKIGISPRSMLTQKLTQTILSAMITALLVIIIY